MTLRKIGSSAIIILVVCCSFLFSYLSVPSISYAEDSNQETYVNVDNDNDALAGVIAYLNYRGLGFLSNNINAVRALLSDSQVELSEFYDNMKKTPAGILRFTYNAQALLQLNKIAQYYIDKYGILNYDSSASPVTHNVYSGSLVQDPNGVKALVYKVGINSSSQYLTGIKNTTVEVGGAYLYTLSYFTGNSGNLTPGFPLANPSFVSKYYITSDAASYPSEVI